MSDRSGGERPSLGSDARVARLAREQHGVFSRTQATKLGMTDKMIRARLTDRRLEERFRDVFRVSGAPATWEQLLISVILYWGSRSAASHRGAAAVWELTGVPRRIPEVTVPPGRKRAGDSPGIVHRHVLPSSDVTKKTGIPVTTVTRTLIDLAGVVSEEALEIALDHALRRKLTTIPKIRGRLKQLEGTRRRGIGILRAMLDDREGWPVPMSLFETRVLRCFRKAGLPRPALQFEIRDADGLIGIADFAFLEQRLIVEADGYESHADRIPFDRDRNRRNRLTLLGWRVIHITWTDFQKDPARCAEIVRRALTG